MFRIFCFVTTLCLAMALLSALPVSNGEDSNKMLSTTIHMSGSLKLETTNLGYINNLTYPQNSGFLLFNGSQWISAKRPRRDSLGRLLYWLSPNPTAQNSETVTSQDPLWTPNLLLVLDSLTTVGHDGDDDINEFLPAYNPLVIPYPSVPYETYNSQDIVLKSILGWPAPRPFTIPDPQGNYCFTVYQGGYFDTPGFETNSAYYYDYCPFGTPGDRDWGSGRLTSLHYPLGLAVHRESYAWPLQNYDKLFILKYTLYNTSTIDTLYDLAISELADCDVRPESYGTEGNIDDVSGYVKGAGYEFAYTRDADGDGGISTEILAHKIILPNHIANRAAWFWKVGHGPNDKNPLDLQPFRQTANEKYWLATGRNPNTISFAPLRPKQSEIMEYEQPVPNDTRFLNTLFGNLPTSANPNPAGRLNLAPGETLSYYSVYFVGNSITEMKQKSVAIDAFIDSGFNLGQVNNLTCIPYLYDLSVMLPVSFQLSWESYSDPDHFEVKYKELDEPASQWNSTNLPGSARSYNINGLDPEAWYEIKICSVYNPGANEVSLESETKLVCINNIVANEDLLQSPGIILNNYPNPFNPSTTVEIILDKATELKLSVYNLKGQMVKELTNGFVPSGTLKAQWDGKDNANKPCASGIYYLKLSTEKGTKARKMLLMK